MFTGKNKEDFEKWYSENQIVIEYVATEDGDTDKYSIGITRLYEHPFSMQQGVYLEYLDNLCIRVIPDYDINKNLWFAWVITNDHINRVKIMSKGNGRNVLYFGNRKEAITEAFKKADELINRI